jgi:hypothetical protein
MDSLEEMEASGWHGLEQAFRDQLMACLEECAKGRQGLFSSHAHVCGEAGAWPEAERLRELAMALQNLFAHYEERNPLCEEFLDLCTIHGESDPGEARLARAFLKRIEKDEVGTQPEQQPFGEKRPW